MYNGIKSDTNTDKKLNNTSYVQFVCTGKTGKSHKAKNSKSGPGTGKEGGSTTGTDQQAGPSGTNPITGTKQKGRYTLVQINYSAKQDIRGNSE